MTEEMGPFTQQEIDKIAGAVRKMEGSAEVTVFEDNMGLDVNESTDAGLPPLDSPWLEVNAINVTVVWKDPDYGRRQERLHIAVTPHGLAAGNREQLGTQIKGVMLAAESAIQAAEARWRQHERTEAAIKAEPKVTAARKEEPPKTKVEEL